MLARGVVVVLFIGILAVLWLPNFTPQSQLPFDFEEELIPEFTAKLLHQELFDANGELQQEVFSQKMEHFSELSLTHFISPEFIIYQDRKPFWRLSAQIGDMQEGILTLDKNVIMVQLGEKSLIQTIKTNFLEINLDSNLVTTDNPITITGDKLTIVGQGLVANLTEGTVTLTHHVETLIKGNK